MVEILKVLFNFFLWLWEQWCRCNLTLTTQDIWAWGLAGDSWRSIYINPPGAASLLPSPSPLSFFFLVCMAERVQPQRELWVIKKRARSKGLGGCGLGDHETCGGPFPTGFSQQKVRLVRTSVCLCACRMKASWLWEICIFYITLPFFSSCQSISNQFCLCIVNVMLKLQSL